jgi:hypothetical protein
MSDVGYIGPSDTKKRKKLAPKKPQTRLGRMTLTATDRRTGESTTIDLEARPITRDQF